MLKFRNLSSFLLLLSILIFDACSEKNERGEPGQLVSTAWLQDHLDDPDLIILHSGTGEFFDSIHIPGARLIIPSHFTRASGELRNEIPPADSLVILLRKVGVNNDSRIVLYAQSASLLSRTARIFVTLDHLGLGERTHVLNGGLPAWQEEEGELSSRVPEISPGNLAVENLKKVVIGSEELDRQRWSEKLVLIDTRSDEEYYGSPAGEEGPAEGGHIEGAYFFPYQDLLQEDNSYLFKPDSEMETLFRIAGMDKGKKTVVYCGSGIRASMTYLAARHLGYPVLLYDGSYEEWNYLGLPLTGPVARPGTNE
jgi:thiosulfate/3-mercaptopyruvate sulfurtransferase